jgi:hypothetical protein
MALGPTRQITVDKLLGFSAMERDMNLLLLLPIIIPFLHLDKVD